MEKWARDGKEASVQVTTLGNGALAGDPLEDSVVRASKSFLPRDEETSLPIYLFITFHYCSHFLLPEVKSLTSGLYAVREGSWGQRKLQAELQVFAMKFSDTWNMQLNL